MFSGYKNMWKYCFNFHALERKKDYWSAFIINAVICLILWLFCFLSVWMLVPVLIYNALSVVPLISMTVRRLHDVDCSGFYLFFILIPIVGWVLVFVKLLGESCYDYSTKRRNETTENKQKTKPSKFKEGKNQKQEVELEEVEEIMEEELNASETQMGSKEQKNEINKPNKDEKQTFDNNEEQEDNIETVELKKHINN